jgi:hypothetical protein
MPTYSIDVDEHAIRLHFERLPIALRAKLRTTITELTNQLLNQVRAREPVRTGLLRASTRSYVDDFPDHVRGRVRIAPTGRAQRTAAAFGALEYGVHGTYEVRAYRRGQSMVSAYQRTINIAARRFLRDPLGAIKERAEAEIEAAVEKSIAEANAAS